MDIPPELVREILLRLPVKSLVRFKCVSKQWLSLLSDSHFAKSHFDLATINNNNNKLMYLSRSKVYSVKIAGPSLHHDYKVQLQAICRHERTKIIGSCRGFLLLQNGSMLVLWNPVTDSHKIVLYPSYASCPCSYFSGGFGYEESNDDYLIVIGMVRAMQKPCWKFYSLRTNSWKDIEGGDCFRHSSQFGLLYNEAIHWLAVYDDGEYQPIYVIVAFDTATKTLSEIPLPYPANPLRNSELSLLGGRGHFGIYMMNNNKQEIWVMKEYKVESSWTKLSILLLFPSYRSMIPLCFADSGDEVVCRKDNNKELVKYSNKGVLGKCALKRCNLDPIVVTFTESLFSLPSSY